MADKRSCDGATLEPLPIKFRNNVNANNLGKIWNLFEPAFLRILNCKGLAMRKVSYVLLFEMDN